MRSIEALQPPHHQRFLSQYTNKNPSDPSAKSSRVKGIGQRYRGSVAGEDLTARVPLVVVAAPGVDVPVTLVGVPEHAHDAGRCVEQVCVAVVEQFTPFAVWLIGDEFCDNPADISFAEQVVPA